MKYGKLFYDDEIERVNVKFEDGTYGDGFHCGDVIEAKIPEIGKWEHYRIEYNDSPEEWYFVGIGSIPCLTEMRIDK